MRPLRILKWVAIAIGALLLLVVLLIGVVTWYMTPERLTPLVKEQASRYINADTEVERVELFFWSTFPRVVLEADNIALRSRAFDRLPDSLRSQLPEYADSLLSLRSLRASLNIPALLAGTIKLHDVEICRPKANLVTAPGGIANFDILTAADTTESSSSALPNIEIDRFAIIGPTPLRYHSIPDSTNITVHLTTTSITGDDIPRYLLNIDGSGGAMLAGLPVIQQIPFGLNGNVAWSASHPAQVEISKFKISAANIDVTIDTRLDFTDSLRIDGFELYDARIHVKDIAHLAGLAGFAPAGELETDLMVDLAVKLHSPYVYTPGSLPDIEVVAKIPDGHLYYDRMTLQNLAADITARLPKGDINRATVDINNFTAIGRSVGFKLTGRVSAQGDIANPLAEGHFEGGVHFDNLPQQLLRRLPFTFSGLLTGNTDFRLHPSDLTKDNFHKLKADGKVTLNHFNLQMRDSSATAMTRKAVLAFGSSSKLSRGVQAVDSLLTVSLNIDTLAYMADGIRMTGADLHAGIGARNVASSFDTTQINPLAARITARRFAMFSDSDSVRLNLRNIETTAALLRYKKDSRKPLLTFKISTERLHFADRLNRANLRDAAINLKLHPRERPRMSRRLLAIYDSLGHVMPNLAPDSLYTLAQAEQRKKRRNTSGTHRTYQAAADSTSKIDFGVDNSLQTWLRLWEASGSIEARRGRAFTPFFPIRNLLTDLKIDFNTDSVVIHPTTYRSGESKLVVDGSIRNITSAVTSRRGDPIELKLNINADTLDINHFAHAAFAGSAFASRLDSTTVYLSDSESDDEMQKSIEQATEGSTVAFVVPINVDAELNIKAREVLYADIWFQRLGGKVEVSNGAVRLNRLAGYTDMGSLDITALYSAPDIHDVDFAAGLVVRRLNLKKFLHMMPQIDSILPLLRHVEGLITANMAMTTELDSVMDIKFNTLKAALQLQGDSLVLLDSDTFRKISKWLLFKHKNHNMIDHMNVEMDIQNNNLSVYPFQFDFDRYKLGVWGNNDLDMNYNYHIAVLKSPIPFKFGVTIKGHGDDFKVRLGGAKFNPDQVVKSRHLTDTTRINLVKEIANVFKFGVKSGRRNRKLSLTPQGSLRPKAPEYSVADTLTHADSVLFMREGVIPMSSAVADSLKQAELDSRKQLKKNKKRKK